MNLKLHDPNGSRLLETLDDCFILGLIIGGAKFESVAFLDYGSLCL